MRRKRKWGKTLLAIALAGAMSVTSVNVPSFAVFAAEQDEQEKVRETGITKFEVYDTANGPKIEYKNNLFSFCLPKVNGSPIASGTLDEVKNGYVIQVKNGDTWRNIEDADSEITYSEDVANKENTWKYDYWTWDGGGSYGIMFNFKESKQIRFQSVAREDVYVDYTLNYPEKQEEKVSVTSLAFPDNEVDISSQGAYAIAFDSLIVNGEDKVLGSSLQSLNRLKWYIDPKADGNFVELGHEGSGLTWGTKHDLWINGFPFIRCTV